MSSIIVTQGQIDTTKEIGDFYNEFREGMRKYGEVLDYKIGTQTTLRNIFETFVDVLDVTGTPRYFAYYAYQRQWRNIRSPSINGGGNIITFDADAPLGQLKLHEANDNPSGKIMNIVLSNAPDAGSYLHYYAKGVHDDFAGAANKTALLHAAVLLSRCK